MSKSNYFHRSVRLLGEVKRLIGKGVAANLFSQAATIAIQLGSIPLLLTALGGERYGLWILLSSVPAYLSLTDFGISSAGTSDMTVAMAKGEPRRALQVFQGMVALNKVAVIAIVTVAAPVILFVSDAVLPGLALVKAAEVRTILLVLTLQSLLSMCTGTYMGAFQAMGDYHKGLSFVTSIRLAEAAALTTAALLSSDLVVAALAMLCVRVLGLALMIIWLRRVHPVFQNSDRSVTIEKMAILWKLRHPAAASIVLPLGFALSLQGVVLIVGAHLPLTIVAAFSTARTLTRAIVQLMSVVNLPILPAFAVQYGRGNVSNARRLFVLNLIWLIASAAILAPVVVKFGPTIIELWTAGRLTMPPEILNGLLAVACIHGIWLSMSNILYSVNRQAQYAYWYLLFTVMSLVAITQILPMVGISGCLWVLLAAELAMLLLVSIKLIGFFREFASERRISMIADA